MLVGTGAEHLILHRVALNRREGPPKMPRVIPLGNTGLGPFGSKQSWIKALIRHSEYHVLLLSFLKFLFSAGSACIIATWSLSELEQHPNILAVSAAIHRVDLSHWSQPESLH
jgi:hypothetical protein